MITWLSIYGLFGLVEEIIDMWNRKGRRIAV